MLIVSDEPLAARPARQCSQGARVKTRILIAGPQLHQLVTPISKNPEQ
jgi:hypothetical protein